ncbi:hypothetical protein [Butyrivibrio sp. MC2021]|uniref:hypothetical protein n=1 Tax=Butyrivibrio sp. MC2021 TaxID=1408306 RepID=UPI000B03B01C|nr:hypothetical protein [Butyrivibrio sp. MC2021]
MKKRLCLILSVAICFGLLTACGSTSEGDAAVMGVSRLPLEEPEPVSTDTSEDLNIFEEDESFGYGPVDFLQEQSGIYEFDSFDDVISKLTEGQGYAYVQLSGEEEPLLAITDLVFLADNSASEACIYGMRDGKAANIGNVFGNGSAFPLRIENGIIYGGDNHRYETYFISDEWKSLMMKDYISDGVTEGSGQFVGFTRETCKYEDTKDFTGGQEQFDALIEAREQKPLIEFTIIK